LGSGTSITPFALDQRKRSPSRCACRSTRRPPSRPAPGVVALGQAAAIDTLSGTRFLRCPATRPGLRSARPVRTERVSSRLSGPPRSGAARRSAPAKSAARDRPARSPQPVRGELGRPRAARAPRRSSCKIVEWRPGPAPARSRTACRPSASASTRTGGSALARPIVETGACYCEVTGERAEGQSDAVRLRVPQPRPRAPLGPRLKPEPPQQRGDRA
jgi:hypothetical protein